MSYAVKWRWDGEREDGTNYRVQILQNGWAGGITTDFELSAELGGPWTHHVGIRGDDVDTALSDHLVMVYAIVEGDEFSEIEDGDETEYLLQILSGTITPDTTQFFGIVDTSLGERLDAEGRHVVMITARSGLSFLENVAYPVTSGRESLRVIAQTCLAELPYGPLPMQTIDRWFTSAEQSGDPFDNVYADQAMFEGMTCREVLEQVVGRKMLNLRQSEGRWLVQQPDALYEGTTRWYIYNADGTFDSTFGSYNPAREYDKEAFRGPPPTVFKRPPYGQIDITYEHREFADTTFENADFEIAGTEGTGGEVMPEGWTSSNLSNMRSRWNAGTLEIDFFYRSSRLTGDAPTSNWWAFQQGEEITTDQAAGSLVFEAQVMPRTEGQGFNPFGTIHHPRILPVAIEVGQYFWDAEKAAWQGDDWELGKGYLEGAVVYHSNTHWECIEGHISDSTSEPAAGGSYETFWRAINPTGNKVYVTPTPETLVIPMDDWPQDGPVTVRFHAPIDDRATSTTGAAGNNPAGWDSDVRAVQIDNVRLQIADSSGIEARSVTTSTALTTGASRRSKEYRFKIGQGPTRAHLTRLTDSSGGEVLGWQFEDDFSGGSSGVDLDEFHGLRAMSMLRKARAAKTYKFKRVTFEMTPGRVLLDGGARYYPVYFHSTPYFGLFGGEYVRIRRDGETGLQTTRKEERAASFISSSGRTQLFQEFSDQIFNTLGATQATETTDLIEAGSRTSADIEPVLAEIGKDGAKVVLIDPDTADRHVLTLTGPILTGVSTMSFEAYDFPKNIREGAPIFPHSGDIAASLVVAEGAIALAVTEGEVLSQFTVEAEGITADTNIFRSGDWDGTVDANGAITAFSSQTGWAFSGAGHFEFTDGTDYFRWNGSNFEFEGHIDASSIRSGTLASARIGAKTITAGHIDVQNLAAINADLGTITAGTIDASLVTITNLDADNITAGTIATARFGAKTIKAGHIDVQNLAAISADLGAITAGTIDASLVTVTNLDASEITSGTIDASVISVTNLDADNITAGTIATARFGAKTIKAGHIDVQNLEALSANMGALTVDDTLTIAAGGELVAISGTGNSVTLSSAGITAVSNLLGTTFDLPSDGSAPTFSSGVIKEVEFQIYTSGVIRTSDTALDGSASSAGILINNTGIYAGSANQNTTNANFRVKTDGTVNITGTVTITGGSGIGNLSDAGALAGQNTVSSGFLDTNTIRVRYRDVYSVRTADPAKLKNQDGTAPVVRSVNGQGVTLRCEAKTTGTGTNSYAVAVFTSDGLAWSLEKVYEHSTPISNRPEFFIDSDGDPAIRTYNHTSFYNVEVYSEFFDSETPQIVGTVFIADGAVTAEKLTIGSVKDIDANAAVVSDIIDSYNDLNDLPTLGILSALDQIDNATYIANGVIVTDHLAADAVTAAKIAAGAIETEHLAAGSVTAAKIDVADLFSQNATIEGTLTMGAGGGITNSTQSYTISDSGILLQAGANASNRISWAGGVFFLGMELGSGALIRTGNADINLITNAGQTIALTSSAFTYNSNTVWHAGNDGPGSGLDADTVDGAQLSGITQWHEGFYTGAPGAGVGKAGDIARDSDLGGFYFKSAQVGWIQVS